MCIFQKDCAPQVAPGKRGPLLKDYRFCRVYLWFGVRIAVKTPRSKGVCNGQGPFSFPTSAPVSEILLTPSTSQRNSPKMEVCINVSLWSLHALYLSTLKAILSISNALYLHQGEHAPTPPPLREVESPTRKENPVKSWRHT